MQEIAADFVYFRRQKSRTFYLKDVSVKLLVEVISVTYCLFSRQ